MASTVRCASGAGSDLVLWHLDSLQRAKSRYQANPSHPDEAIAHLVRDAHSALQRPVRSVVEKTATPPSGDRHDYMSVAIYWWPDPSKPNGLPYIERDGVRNQALTHEYPDQQAAEEMMRNVETLALSSFVLDDTAHARRAVDHLRSWFLAPATKMNPNLQFAQSRPGLDEGTPQGIIEFQWLPRLLESIKLLETTGALNDEEKRALDEWMKQLLEWLRTSKSGIAASRLPNNIGTYYDAEVVALALFCGDTAAAKAMLEKVKSNRLATQIAADGKQPLEIKRSKGLGYSIFNLEALATLAEYGHGVGVDLWHYRAPDGAGIKAAFEFVAPFALKEKRWPFDQIEDYNPQNFVSLTLRMRKAYGDAACQHWMDLLPSQPRRADRANLLY